MIPDIKFWHGTCKNKSYYSEDIIYRSIFRIFILHNNVSMLGTISKPLELIYEVLTTNKVSTAIFSLFGRIKLTYFCNFSSTDVAEKLMGKTQGQKVNILYHVIAVFWIHQTNPQSGMHLLCATRSENKFVLHNFINMGILHAMWPEGILLFIYKYIFLLTFLFSTLH